MNLFDTREEPTTLEELREFWKDCEKCSFAPACKGPVLWDGTKEANVMFVGQYPGKQEEKLKQCYIGEHGKLCRKTAKSIAKIPVEEQFWTNVLSCRPLAGKISVKYISNCFDLLEAQIDIVKPKLIVIMGLLALTRLSKGGSKLGIEEMRRRPFGYNRNKTTCVVATFPALWYRLEGQEEQQNIIGDKIRLDWEFVGNLYRRKKDE